MENDFITDSGKSSLKERIKRSIPAIATVGVALVVLAILMLPSRIETANSCNSLGVGITTGSFLSNSCAQTFSEIVFVVGDTANTPNPVINFPNYISIAHSNSGITISKISVANPARNPIVIAGNSTDYSKTAEIAQSEISEMSALYDGADYLGAIRTAARSVEDKEHALIYVIGSGLSDKGLLNFAEGAILTKSNGGETDKDLDKFLNEISKKITDPTELRGITILWDGLGQTVAPQAPLNNTAKGNLEYIYSDILKSLGAKSNNLIFKNKLSGEESASGKTVKTSSFADEKIDTTYDLSAESTFEGNSATFINRAKTEEDVAKIVEDMKSHPTATATITAYMSRGTCSRDQVDYDLLNKRGNAIKELLINGGISENRIITIAGGFGDAPECNDGNYDSIEGQKNRKVTISVKN